MSRFPFHIDATCYLPLIFHSKCAGQLDQLSEVQTFQFGPGDQYQCRKASGLVADFTFKVTDQEKVDYDASFNVFFSGRGTDTLMILGWEVTFDAQRLTTSHPAHPNGSGVILG